MCALLLWNQHFDSENQLSVYFTIMKSTFCKSLQVAIGWLIPKYSFPYISCSYTELETSACYFRYNQVDVLRHLDRSSVLPIHLNWYREPMIGHSFFFFFFFLILRSSDCLPILWNKEWRLLESWKYISVHTSWFMLFQEFFCCLKPNSLAIRELYKNGPFTQSFWFSQALLPIKNDRWSRQLAFLPPEP